MIKYLILFLSIAAIAWAGSESGTHKDADGDPIEGAMVAVYSFGTAGDYDISNATLVGTDTTDVNGEWSVATTLTTKHLVVIKDGANVDKTVTRMDTPSE